MKAGFSSWMVRWSCGFALVAAGCTASGKSQSHESPPETTIQPAASSSTPVTAGQGGRPENAQSLFAFDTLLVEGELRPGVWGAFGTQEGKPVSAGAVYADGIWTIRHRQIGDIDCVAVEQTALIEVSSDTVLIASCYDGGSAGDSYVLALASPDGNTARIVLDISCGYTPWRFEGDTLVIGSSIDGISYRDSRLRWQGSGFTAIGPLADTCQRTA